jgi:hypothetical protein
MPESIQWFFRFVGFVWTGIGEAMRLNPVVFEIIEGYPDSSWIVLTIALLGGASLLLGQSVILFVNRVTPKRFLLSLLLNGLVFTFGLIIWAVSIWFVGRWLLSSESDLGTIIALVALGAAPYALGFFILMPYLGHFLGRVLAVWSFLVVLAAAGHIYQIDRWLALVVVGSGWLLSTLFTATVGRPLVALRNWLFRLVTGSQLDATVRDVLTGFLEEDPVVHRSKGKMP